MTQTWLALVACLLAAGGCSGAHVGLDGGPRTPGEAGADGTGPGRPEAGPERPPACTPGPGNPAEQLSVGRFTSRELVASSKEEQALSLKPQPGIDRTRIFWVYEPAGYDRDCAPPLVVALHPRGELDSFKEDIKWGEAHLRRWAQRTLDLWKPLAASHHFLLVVPLGDPDILWMGMTWLVGDRGTLFEQLLDTVAAEHPFDRARVYLAGSGEGAHAAVATAVRRGDRFAAVAATNAPLLSGASRRPYMGRTIILPETVDELGSAFSARRVPLLFRAGTAETALRLNCHSNSALPGVCRYQDDSALPFDGFRPIRDRLEGAGFEAKLQEIPGPHYTALGAADVEAVWEWLAGHRN